MLLIILFAFIAAILIGISVAIDHISNWDDGCIFKVFGTIALIVCIGMIFVSANINIHKEVDIQNKLLERENLVYQLQHDYYNRITYDGREELMKNILKFNQGVISHRILHDNIWVGVFYPQDWDSIPLIELK